MRLRRTLNYHSLKRGKVRQTWNKYNLYNIQRVARTIPNFLFKTFFQQKWAAKSLTRAYHGEHIKERKWERMFSRRLMAVVNMDPEYMARNDGSEQAAGRGSGRDKPRPEDVMPWFEREQELTLKGKGGLTPRDIWTNHSSGLEELDFAASDNAQARVGQTPYMSMAYAPLERRIDVAIHRAMFASSTRQARSFVIHGAVKVNGKVMTHPSYLLNPGDMFQIKPDFVMFATGRKKPTRPPVVEEKPKRKRAKASKKSEKALAKGHEEQEDAQAESDAPAEATGEESAEATDEGSAPASDNLMELAKTNPKVVLRQLNFLSSLAKNLIGSEKKGLPVKKKKRLRVFIQSSRAIASRLGRPDAEKAVTMDLVATINDTFKELLISYSKASKEAKKSKAFTEAETAEATAAAAEAIAKAEEKKKAKTEGAEKEIAAPKPTKPTKPQRSLTPEQLEKLKKVVESWEENPIDESKPYATPWRPRRYMSPFAFIPRYLEVNQNICAAVYLRHPVARQGQSEVPSPFPPHVMQLAFNWYLRRR